MIEPCNTAENQYSDNSLGSRQPHGALTCLNFSCHLFAGLAVFCEGRNAFG